MPIVFRWLLGALFGGAVGATIWTLVETFTHAHVHWMSMGVGALAGLGAAAMGEARAGGRQWGAGAAAVLGGAVALWGARTIENHRLYEIEERKAIAAWEAEAADETQRVALVAAMVAGEREAAGQTIDWPESAMDLTGSPQAWYPEDLWAEAQARYRAMTPDQSAALVAGARSEFLAQIDTTPREKVIASFIFWTRDEVIWASVGAALAFGLGVFGGAGAGGRRAAGAGAGAEG